jgi:hypothetical protein
MDYDLKANILYNDGQQVPAYSFDKNEMGNCSNCDGILISLSYHSVEDTSIVVTRCSSCGSFFANEYDSQWNWINETPVSLLPVRILISNPIIDDIEGLEKIPRTKLEAVFSRGEIEAIFASARNETPIRQYLYRARRKYALFEEVFDLRLEF